MSSQCVGHGTKCTLKQLLPCRRSYAHVWSLFTVSLYVRNVNGFLAFGRSQTDSVTLALDKLRPVSHRRSQVSGQ